eukprot:scaffold544_cov256-Pinguiococcus_pyrenoidosus.AAC.2
MGFGVSDAWPVRCARARVGGAAHLTHEASRAERGSLPEGSQPKRRAKSLPRLTKFKRNRTEPKALRPQAWCPAPPLSSRSLRWSAARRGRTSGSLREVGREMRTAVGGKSKNTRAMPRADGSALGREEGIHQHSFHRQTSPKFCKCRVRACCPRESLRGLSYAGGGRERRPRPLAKATAHGNSTEHSRT